MASLFTLLMVTLFLVAPSPVAAQDYYIEFWADQTQIWRGQCTTLYWNTDNVRSVFYNGQPVSGIEQSRVECPTSDTTYNLWVNTRDGRQINRQVYIQVSEPPTGWVNPGNNMVIDFWADRTRIQAGECVTIYWNTNNVQTVHYKGRGVSGINQTRVECPDESTTYHLRVRTRTGQDIFREVHVQVFGSSFDRGELEMRPSQLVDFDDNGDVSAREDDFRWYWNGGEAGLVVKADDDDDLRLAIVEEGSQGQFDRLSLDECRGRLADDDENRLEVEEASIFCFRTDGGDYGKARVEDIRNADGRLELDWYLWE